MSLSTMTISDRYSRRRIGAVSVDLSARRASVDDRLLELTALEFDLLAYLAARPGHVFSRDQLLRAVWESTAEWQQPATVTEHIRRLRLKIETEPRHPRILRTVRGAGYRLDEPRVHEPGDGTEISLELMPPQIDWYGSRARHVAGACRCSVRSDSALPRFDGLGGTAAMNEDTRYRALFERAADAVFVADDDGTYVDANPAAVRMFGVERDDLIGRRVADFVVDDDITIEQRWSTFVGSDGESGRVRIRRGDGQVIICDFNATANFVPGQHLSIMRDVTEMVEAQHRREQSELRFRRMLDALELFALVTDVDGRLTFMNRAMLTRLGVESSQVIGRRLTLLQPNGEEQHQAFLSAIATGVITPEWENEIAVADGTCRVRWSSAFVRDGQGRIEAVASIGEDITVRRRLEEQVRHAVRMESLGRLAGGVAHDFNNFLTVVRGHVDLLAQAPELTETSSDHLEQITAGIDRAARLTRQLLAYGRQQVMEPREVSVGDVLQHLRTMLAPMLGASVAIEIVRHTDDDVVVIDPTQLDQVLVNLAMNARDAMPAGGLLRFDVTTTDIDDAMGALLDVVAGRYVTLSVTDTGAGIPTDLLEHVFEPFVSTKPDGTGTGLGLATAYGIIAQSGGAITADSRPGDGATFVIHLPSPRP